MIPHSLILVLSGVLLAALGIWAYRVDYLKWPRVTAVVAGDKKTERSVM